MNCSKSLVNLIRAGISLSAVVALISTATAQTAVKSSPVPTQTPALQLSPAEQTFRQEQAALGDQLATLIQQGASSSQIAAWQQSVAVRQAAQLQRAQALSASHGNTVPLITEVTLPADASPQLQSLLVNQVDLANASIQLNNQVAAAQGNQTIPAIPSADQAAALQQQTASLRQNQAQVSSTLADQTINTAIPIPDAPTLPATMPLKLRTFLLLRHQLMKERAQLWNQNLSITPAARIALIQQWQQQNATRISQLQQQAQALSPAQN